MIQVRQTRALLFAAAAALFFPSTDAFAQLAKVEVKGVEVAAQQTPQFEFKGTTDKKWKPKTWAEIETVFEIKLANREAEFADQIQFKYYLVLKGDRERQRTLTGEITHVNVPVDQEVAAVAYISPATIQKVTGNDTFSKADIAAFGVEIFYLGQTMGGEAQPKKAWWNEAGSPPREEGRILAKPKTPFAPLWGDYHLDVEATR